MAVKYHCCYYKIQHWSFYIAQDLLC